MKRIITAEEAGNVERWDVPSVGEPKAPARLTASELEELQRQAHQEGFQAGYKDGIDKGQAQIKAQVERLSKIMALLQAPLDALDDKVEEELVALAVAVARQIIRRELKTDPGQIVAAVREAVGALPLATRQVRIHLHPEDATLVRDAIPPPAEGEQTWQITDDPALQRGDCKIWSDTSQVDATVEKRIASVAAAILARERQGEE